MPVARWRFTVEDYERMAEAGILDEDDRVELIDGEVVEMAPIGPPHASCVMRLLRLFASLLGQRALVSPQNPVRLGTYSEPQPDVAVLRPREDFYAARHPGPDDVLLVVEVSWSTGPFDRVVKMPLYARAGLRQAWLVDLDANAIEVYRDPSSESYGDLEVLTGDDQINIDAFPDVTLTVGQILG